jgi:hypothetical protein
MILSENRDYFLNSINQLIYNGEALCFLWDKDLILKYYLDELRLQVVILWSFNPERSDFVRSFIKEKLSSFM